MTDHYDVIVVGTSFAASFFLKRYLEHAPKTARVLVLERGNSDDKAWQLEHRKTSSIDIKDLFINNQPEKEWLVSPGFGGNSKCWWGGATRMMPGDFQLRTRYGVGTDWPMRYEDLETYYGEVEKIMAVSGPVDSPMPRTTPLPLPPHRFSDPDAILKKAFPDGWYHPATVRATVATGTRGVCCATGLCELCPQDAKFTIQNGLAHLYTDPRVSLLLQAEAKEVIKQGDIASGVSYARNGQMHTAKADLVVLAANAIFNPYLLLRSGITHPLLGKGLHEQMPVDVCVNLHGVKAYNGSTSISGNGYLFYEGEHRREHAACLIETWNAPFNYRRAALRSEQGRWTERAYLRFMFDDLPRLDNTVTISSVNPEMPETNFNGYSDYAMRGMEKIPAMVETLAKALPIESIESINLGRTTAHIQGTVVMGNDPQTSVVDRHLLHHQIRNLAVLGSSSYPTASPAYPTLTLSALSLWSADHLFAKGTKNA
ncbi:MAG: GMC family oxidoreductase [Gammaproteobacteria bacterium]|nr:GMC family oxidoreductase [Gammaproteobacteria bacterium]